MKYVFALGNPGEKYQYTRHNAGFLFADYLSTSEISSNYKIKYNEEFMNEAGLSARIFMDFFKFKIDDFFLVHDDLDLELGEYKIQKAIGPKLHNGIASVEKHLGTKEFMRIRIGIDARNKQNKIPGESYVLENFSASQIDSLDTVFGQIVTQLARMDE